MHISPPLRILLAVTLALTVLSYAVRSWRESAALPPVIEGAVPARLPASDGGSDEVRNSRQLLRNPELLRPIWPIASIDAMAGRPSAGGSQSASVENAAPPPPAAELPGPTFRLVGRYVDGKTRRIFFAHGDALIAVRVGQALPDGFTLKSASHDKVTVVRTVDGHLFDMTLEAP